MSNLDDKSINKVGLDKWFVTPTSKENEVFEGAMLLLATASPFISYLGYSCKVNVIEDCPMVTTAAAYRTATGNHIVFDRTFMGEHLKNYKEVAFVFYHEILHIFHEHLTVSSNYLSSDIEKELKNYADDYFINAMASGYYLDKDGRFQESDRIKKSLEFPSFGGLLEKKYAGKTEVEIYHDLVKEAEKQTGKSLQEMKDAEEEAKKKIMEALEKALGKNFDDGVFEDGDMTDEQREANSERVQQTLIDAMTASENSSNMVGPGEAGLVDRIKKMIKPVVSWQDRVFSTVTNSMRITRTYARYNRKSKNRFGIVYPAHKGEHVNIVVGIDSSGSMGRDSDLVRCYSEFIHLLERFESYTCWVLTCDTKAHLIDTVTSEEFSPSDYDLKVVGGGGTEMAPMIEWAYDLQEEEDTTINACVIMTDGGLFEGDIESVKQEGIDTIVMVTDTGNSSLNINKAGVEVIHCRK